MQAPPRQASNMSSPPTELLKKAGSGEISLRDKASVITDRASQQTRMNARQATYQSASSIMRLSGDVVIYQTANDMTLKTQYAEADIENGLFEVPENVTIQSPRMSLVADSMTSRDKGQYYLFGGQSKLVLKQETDPNLIIR